LPQKSEAQKKPRARHHDKTNDHTIKLVTDPIVRVGLIQMACSRDPGENLAKAEWRIREAAGKGAQIICLQELFRSQYFCREEDARLFDLAESIPGATRALAGLARDLKVVIIASLFERRAAAYITTPRR
jgi:predicted amidohydrolase